MEPNTNNKPCPRDKVELYYHLLSGSVRLKLLESVMNLNLPELIGTEGELTCEEIIEKLQLSPKRAKKWFYLLSMEKFLIEKKHENKNTTVYSLGPILKALFDNGDDWWFYKELVNSWQIVSNENMVDMLQGKELSFDVNWPPSSTEESLFLETWMTRTSEIVIKVLNSNMPLENPQKILDVGGGDGTIDCALAQMHPSLKFTVYNLPVAISLIKDKIEEHHLNDRIDVYSGNFLTDEAFPKGYDIVLFSRTMCDWPEDVCRKLIKMAYEALNEKGIIVICEEFKDLNQNLMLAWEFRYMFWDNFGKALYKPSELYLSILKETGFSDGQLSEISNDTMFRVIKAMKGRSYDGIKC